jgi:hypothetical protein
MNQLRTIKTDDTGARALSSLIASVGDSVETFDPASRLVTSSDVRIVRFLENVNPGDYGQKMCALMRFNGTEFVDTKQRVPVRCISAAGVAASKTKPVQAVARATGPLGLCAELPLHRQAFLTEDMLAAVSTRRDPSTATCLLMTRKANGDFARSSHALTIVNRFEDISAHKNTYIKIEVVDGEWQPYAANCPSQDSESESF